MQIHQVVNPYRSANSYIIVLDNNEAAIIDVGDIGTCFFINWFQQNNKTLRWVILTHEHSDHCVGVNALFKELPFKLICSPACAANIANKKQNFSLYLEEIETFEITMPVQKASEAETLTLGGHTFTFIDTPGHSPGSMCIKLANHFFTGDTLLPEIKTPLNFPHSNRNEYQLSLNKLSVILENGMRLYPGHGDAFTFNSTEHLNR